MSAVCGENELFCAEFGEEGTAVHECLLERKGERICLSDISIKDDIQRKSSMLIYIESKK